MKRSKKLIILLLVFTLCIGAYLIISAVIPETDSEAESSETQLVSIDEASVTDITWTYDAETVSLHRSDSGWQYADDPELPLDASYIDTMLAAVCSVTGFQSIPEPESISEYGLTVPLCTIETVLDTGKSITFTIGDLNTFSGYYYMILNNDSSTVWLVDSAICDAFSFGLYDILEDDTVTGIV